MYKYIFFCKILFLSSDTDSPLHYLIYSRSFITSDGGGNSGGDVGGDGGDDGE